MLRAIGLDRNPIRCRCTLAGGVPSTYGRVVDPRNVTANAGERCYTPAFGRSRNRTMNEDRCLSAGTTAEASPLEEHATVSECALCLSRASRQTTLFETPRAAAFAAVAFLRFEIISAPWTDTLSATAGAKAAHAHASSGSVVISACHVRRLCSQRAVHAMR